MKANIAWNTIGSVFYQGCLWLMTVLVVRLSADYQNSGMLAFAMSIGNIYTALGTYTMRTYQVSDVNNENSAGNYVALRFVTVFGALIACGIYGLAVSPTPATLIVVAAFLLFKADESFVNVMYGCDQKAMRLDYVGQSQIIRGCLVVGIFVGGMLLTGSLVLTLVLIFLGCLSVTVFFDTRKTSAVVDSLRPRITRERCLRLLKVCLPRVSTLASPLARAPWASTPPWPPPASSSRYLRRISTRLCLAPLPRRSAPETPRQPARAHCASSCSWAA